MKIKRDSSTTNNEIYYFYLLFSSRQVSNNSHSTVTNCSISQYSSEVVRILEYFPFQELNISPHFTMEEADTLMLTTLRNLQCHLDSEILSISQLSTEQVSVTE